MALFHIELDILEQLDTGYYAMRGSYGKVISSGGNLAELRENAKVEVLNEDGTLINIIGLGDLSRGFMNLADAAIAEKLEELQFMEDSYAR